MYDENDVYDEIVEAHLRGDTQTDSTNQNFEFLKVQEIKKIRNKQTEAYFAKFVQAL